MVPGAQRLAAPAHSHDHYEETIYGIEGGYCPGPSTAPGSTSGRDRRSAFHAARFTDSTTTATRT
ncbi:MAG TPA: hypothetical protein VL262_11330 [Vicinamibacterales bacterium]|nr:hypothetical protein [Vicinamibacterales bacterium]